MPRLQFAEVAAADIHTIGNLIIVQAKARQFGDLVKIFLRWLPACFFLWRAFPLLAHQAPRDQGRLEGPHQAVNFNNVTKSNFKNDFTN